MSGNLKRVIIDTDMGTDDAMGLLIFIFAVKLGIVKIEGIVCTSGNTARENVVKNVIRMLEATNMTQIPVYRGTKKPLIPFRDTNDHYHGLDGFGDLVHDQEPNISIVKEKSGVEAIYDLVSSNPKQISVIGMGALTNIAFANRLSDDFMDNVKDIWIMGGNYKGVGNTANGGSSEFNFFMDPESAYSILDGANSENPIHLLPWETCHSSTVPRSFRFDVVGKSTIPALQLLMRAEEVVHKPFEKTYAGCDAQLALVYVFPERAILEEKDYKMSVELHGQQTRGQGVIRRPLDLPPNVRLIEQIDYEFYKEVLLNVGGLNDSLANFTLGSVN